MKSIKSHILLIFLASIMILSLVSCSMNKTPIDTDAFIEAAKTYGLTPVDITEQYKSSGYVNKGTIAAKSEDGVNILYQIEFYEIDTVDNAESMFAQNKQSFENDQDSANSYSSVNVGNHEHYNITIDGRYKSVRRIENTLIFLNVDVQYKDSVNEFLDTIGY